MKLLFDQNISHKILKLLSDEFEGSSSIINEKLVDGSDKSIWEFAKKSNFYLL